MKFKKNTRRVVLIVLMVLPICVIVYRRIKNNRSTVMEGKHLEKKDDTVVREKMTKIRNRMYDLCVHHDYGRVNTIYAYAPKRMAYCPVAKVGSTFWKRVFIYLHNETMAANPFEIPRFFTHYGTLKNMKNYGFGMNVTSSFINMTRFMFVRDPYNRLWSAYLDKFVLPDYWRSLGRKLVSARKSDNNSKSDLCSNDVSFLEFLRFALGKPPTLDVHWCPIHLTCNPCVFRPHLVGKMETFSQDLQYITKYLDIENIFPSRERDSQTEEELRTLIDYNFKLMKLKVINQCLTSKQLALRLWKVFEINGHLPFGSTQKLKGFKKFTSETFTDIVLETRNSADPHLRHEWKKNRLLAIKSAYNSIPEEVIMGIQKRFHLDFVLFNYDPEPPNRRYIKDDH